MLGGLCKALDIARNQRWNEKNENSTWATRERGTIMCDVLTNCLRPVHAMWKGVLFTPPVDCLEIESCRQAKKQPPEQDKKNLSESFLVVTAQVFVKSIPPTTENWLRKHYKYSMKNDKSTEDKHETNHINNKYNDTYTDTRKMHNTWAWTQARTLSHSLMLGHMHLVAQVLSPVMSSMYMCVSPWAHLSHPLLRSVPSPSSPFFFPLMHFEQHTELDNLIAMQNLRTSANKGCNDAYDVSVSLTVFLRCCRPWKNSLFSPGPSWRSPIIPTLLRLQLIVLLPLRGWRRSYWRIISPSNSRVNRIGVLLVFHQIVVQNFAFFVGLDELTLLPYLVLSTSSLYSRRSVL